MVISPVSSVSPFCRKTVSSGKCSFIFSERRTRRCACTAPGVFVSPIVFVFARSTSAAMAAGPDIRRGTLSSAAFRLSAICMETHPAKTALGLPPRRGAIMCISFAASRCSSSVCSPVGLQIILRPRIVPIKGRSGRSSRRRRAGKGDPRSAPPGIL